MCMWSLIGVCILSPLVHIWAHRYRVTGEEGEEGLSGVGTPW